MREIDVRTVHLQNASALPVSVAAQIRAIKNEKKNKYNAYYSRFRPFIVSLTGAVPEDSFGAIKEITREAERVGWSGRDIAGRWRSFSEWLSRP